MSSQSALPPPIAYFGSPSSDRLAAILSEPPLTLNQLLRHGREQIQNASKLKQTRLHIIFGNEASDMDSMVCSIVFAWYLSLIHPPSTGNIFLPMMNIERDQLPLRGESDFTFNQVGLDSSLLLFKEDIKTEELKKQVGDLCVILVDHNHLDAAQSNLSENVVAILDHHKDEELYPRTKELNNRYLEVVGSCTTLLAELILRQAPQLLSEKYLELEPIDYKTHAPPTPLGVVTLLYHVLLLDTNDMSPVTLKYKDKDVYVHEHYHKLLQVLTYAELKRRRGDTSNLTTEQLLAKDTKYGENQKYPHMVCSIPCSLRRWCEKDPDMLPKIERVSRKKGLRFVVLLSSHSDQGKYQREITILVNQDQPTSSNTPQPATTTSLSQQSSASSSASHPSGTLNSSQLFEALKQSFEADTKDLNVAADPNMLTPEVRSKSHHLHVQTYHQQNLHSSRKQVAPLLEGLLSKL